MVPFSFLQKDNPTITASLCLDNLADKVKNEIAKQTFVNKKTLTLAIIKKILKSQEAKQEFVALFERKPTALDEEIKQFHDSVSSLLKKLPT